MTGSSRRSPAPGPRAFPNGSPPGAIRYQFDADLTRDSLTAFTELVRSRICTVEDVDHPANSDFVDGAVTHLGEAMRTAAGGRWAHGSGERAVEKDLYRGVPYLLREDGSERIPGHPYWGVYYLHRRDRQFEPVAVYDR